LGDGGTWMSFVWRCWWIKFWFMGIKGTDLDFWWIGAIGCI